MQDLAIWYEGTALAGALRGSGHLYMVVNAAHILGIGLLLGAIIPLDLRLVGIIRSGPIGIVGPFLSQAAGVGLCIALLTGGSLLSVSASEYLRNDAFRWKMALLGLGLLTIAAQHGGGRWRRAVETGVPDPRTRFLAALSLMVWLSVLLSGRWIGFL